MEQDAVSGFASAQSLKGVALRIEGLSQSKHFLDISSSNLASQSIHHRPHRDITVLDTTHFLSPLTLLTTLSPLTRIKSNQQSVYHGTVTLLAALTWPLSSQPSCVGPRKCYSWQDGNQLSMT